ncbi:Uncharacterised protein [Vibrio cholerae]|nr:Uncharacterised protein [Vibrio cholerae]
MSEHLNNLLAEATVVFALQGFLLGACVFGAF